jgi:hypothetical protein
MWWHSDELSDLKSITYVKTSLLLVQFVAYGIIKAQALGTYIGT